MNKTVSNEAIREYLINCLRKTKENYSERGSKTVLFFQGIPESLLMRAFPAEELLRSPIYPCRELLQNKTALLEQIAASESTVLCGMYEHLCALSELPKDFESVVVENNLFAHGETLAEGNSYLDKLCGLYAGTLPDAELDAALSFYSDIVPQGNRRYKITYSLGGEEAIPLLPSEEASEAAFVNATELDCGGTEYDKMLEAILFDGVIPTNVKVLCNASAEYSRAFALNSLLAQTSLGAVSVSRKNSYSLPAPKSFREEEFTAILKRHWGCSASFRPLRFYADAEHSGETATISQGELIAQISEQAEAALSGRHCRNVFITAPTGSGKSILFQIPAIYLAERYSALSIVVTPLIALMKDQLDSLENERGVTIATYINSTITAEERQKRLEQIRNGEKSLLYLSPELLLSMPIENLINSRRLGLFVVDEAHTVTSWGKDFRSDYWFLGSYLSSLKRMGHNFPVLCLTATAVCGGREDVVGETIESLNIENPLIYLGSVKRENIVFDINSIEKQSDRKTAQSKLELACEYIEQCVRMGEKTLVYTPYTTQVNELYEALPAEVRRAVGRYHGKMTAAERTQSQNEFRDSTHIVMLATKAFGMGVDLSDIKNVYHYAPTGSLADYVQEIGRAGRGNITACAKADYFESDMLYAETLANASSLKQYQLREVAQKLCARYREDGTHALLVSPDAYTALFGESEAENKVKNALLLIAADTAKSGGFPVLTVREQNALGTNYLCVPERCEADFLRRYGAYAAPLRDYARTVAQANGHASDVVVRNFGTVYRIDASGLWENGFSELTFPDFKRKMFDGTLFPEINGEHPSVRMAVRLTYSQPFAEVTAQLKEYLASAADLFAALYKAGEPFTADSFAMQLKKKVAALSGHTENAKAILECFVKEAAENSAFARNRQVDKSKFVRRSRDKNGFSSKYKVMNTNYATLSSCFDKYLSSLAPNEGASYMAYVPYIKQSGASLQGRLINLLQFFGLAEYEVSGGRSDEIFVRINSPRLLAEACAPRAKNKTLIDILAKRQASRTGMGRFMACGKSSEERWELIEQYFLGRNIWEEEEGNE